jgi:hypothetical protein
MLRLGSVFVAIEAMVAITSSPVMYFWTVRCRNSTDFLVDGTRDSGAGLSLSLAIVGLSEGSIFSSEPAATLNLALYQLRITLNFTICFLSIERGLIRTFLLVSNY